MSALQTSASLISRDHGLAGPGSHLVIPSIIGPLLAAILVFNRVYWRIALVNALGHDDICILLSLVFLFAQCTVNLVAVDSGYGRPSDTLTPSQIHRALQMFYLDQIFYKATINLTKLSILALYLRIFSQRWFRITCHACCCIVAIYAFTSIIATIFQCSPLPRFWNKQDYPGHCIDVTAFWYANAIFNILTDVVILLSVPGVVWGLHLPLRQRFGLTLVFGLGVFVFATSILRFTTLNVSSKSSDPTVGTLRSTMWTTIESCTAVVCACLPMLRTPLQHLWPKLFTTKRSAASDTDQSGTDTKIGEEKARKAEEIALTDSPHARGNRQLTQMGTLRADDNHCDLELGKADSINFAYQRSHSLLANPTHNTPHINVGADDAFVNPRPAPSTPLKNTDPVPIPTPANTTTTNKGRSRSQISSTATDAQSGEATASFKNLSFGTTASETAAMSDTDWYASTSGASSQAF